MGTYISTFANGMAFMFFVGAIYRMRRDGCRNRTSLFLEILLLLLALLELKNLIIVFLDITCPGVHGVCLFVDGLAVVACVLYLLEMARPGWLIHRRVVDLSTHNKRPFSFSADWHGNRRMCKLITMLAFSVIFWVADIISVTVWFKVAYEISIILLWSIILNEARDEIEEIVVEAEESDCEVMQVVVEGDEVSFPFKEQLQKVMEDDALYRNPRLTISDVANAIGTNRTYLSAYLNNVLHMSFYDYVNSYRIEHISKKLLESHDMKTMEEIAELSGFNSTSTFRRAFMKNTGVTPMNYRKEALR